MNRSTVMVSNTFRSIAITTVITSILWTIYGIYSAMNKPSDIQVSPLLLQPVTPSINMETIKAVQTRRQIGEELVDEAVVEQALSILLIEPTGETSQASSSAVLPTPPPQASSSALENEQSTDQAIDLSL